MADQPVVMEASAEAFKIADAAEHPGGVVSEPWYLYPPGRALPPHLRNDTNCRSS